jgi:hypothetical protein
MFISNLWVYRHVSCACFLVHAVRCALLLTCVIFPHPHIHHHCINQNSIAMPPPATSMPKLSVSWLLHSRQATLAVSYRTERWPLTIIERSLFWYVLPTTFMAHYGSFCSYPLYCVEIFLLLFNRRWLTHWLHGTWDMCLFAVNVWAAIRLGRFVAVDVVVRCDALLLLRHWIVDIRRCCWNLRWPRAFFWEATACCFLCIAVGCQLAVDNLSILRDVGMSNDQMTKPKAAVGLPNKIVHEIKI